MKVTKIASPFIFLFTIIFLAGSAHALPIQKGSKVKLDYTLSVAGQVIESSQGQEPLEYTQGDGNLIPGLEKQLEGLDVNESRTITVAPEDAYGPVNPEAFRTVPKTMMPEGATPEVGMVLEMETPDQVRIPVMISEVKDDDIVLNFNHPLAGQELQFDIKVLSVE